MNSIAGLGVAIACFTCVSSAPLTMRDLNGRQVNPLENREGPATVLFFICHDCPISNAYSPEINRIYKKYNPKNIGFYAVYAESGIPLNVERQHAKDFGYAFPAIADSSYLLATRVGATVTPEAVVVSRTGKILYRGRIDDTYASLGVRRAEATVHDLRNAIDQVLAGHPVLPSTTQAIGCFITKNRG